MKPASYADRAAALGFALAVAARRRRDGERRPILWAFTAHEACEQGFPHGPGLARFGLDPAALLIVEARRDSEVLWALEEGLRSGALAAVLGSVGKIDETPARRLQLAAQSGATPCLLLTAHGRPGVAVARTRWRIAAAESAPHPLHAPAPGAPRWRLALERCRQRPEGFDATLEWCDAWSPAPFRFRMAAALADREARPGAARRGAG